MTTTHEVISAFIDNEPFDAAALAGALATPEGRALLIDLVSLRNVAQPEDSMVAPASVRRTRRPLLWVAAAASIALAAIGGHQIGARRNADVSAPPPATVVVKASEWTPVSSGGMR